MKGKLLSNLSGLYIYSFCRVAPNTQKPLYVCVYVCTHTHTSVCACVYVCACPPTPGCVELSE